MKLCNIGHSFDYETEKLIRIFLPFEKIEILHSFEEGENTAVCRVEELSNGAKITSKLTLLQKNAEYSQIIDRSETPIESFEKKCERAVANTLFDCFAKLTGYRSPWGILTGVRPARLFSRTVAALGEGKARERFLNELYVSRNKISLCEQSHKGEGKIIELSRPESFSLYVSIPFCPTRCNYCSFVSHSVEKAGELIPDYIEHLCKELVETAKIVKSIGLKLETVYVGGGTPTAISAGLLGRVLETVRENFDMSSIREFTVEAGRPDTVTKEKLAVIKNSGATRISINPQTMNDSVLQNIGRKHTAKQMREAFALAREMGFDNINTDLIAGLSGDTFESFCATVEEILKLDPESVTVHSLSMKRASTITVLGELPDIKAGAEATKMVEYARKRLGENNILPYYMYRQSKTVGNLENVGYAKEGFECLYNVYIMDETHTILACGASAVTKLREPGGDNIERIFNYKYPYEYISRFGDMLQRKQGVYDFYNKYKTKGI
ncbi:MAG: coproporphyrinogen dehydrogenase HemZ [Clostridia bacterium]|nr:coproporphyrinogen dehydrogenase HemZ [Clostridia bacterium]